VAASVRQLRRRSDSAALWYSVLELLSATTQHSPSLCGSSTVN
jgi:hypothetical protein